MEGYVCKPEIGGGLARNRCHKAMFGFFDHTGCRPTLVLDCGTDAGLAGAATLLEQRL